MLRSPAILGRLIRSLGGVTRIVTSNARGCKVFGVFDLIEI